MSLPLDRIVAEIEPFASRGVSFHWLKPKSKAPVAAKWSEADHQTLDQLRRGHRPDFNIGVRLGDLSKMEQGNLYIIDIDIRVPEKKGEALDRLSEIFPGWSDLPVVRSGSGGESMHLYFVCPGSFRSRKLAMSKTFQMIWSDREGREVKKNDWELELFGTGKQVVVPPSIHPDTGLPYHWEKPFDFLALDLGLGPVLPSETVEGWGLSQDSAAGWSEIEDEADELYAAMLSQPIGLDEAEIERIMRDLPEEWVDDRDGWYQAGMALHHEFRGAARGYEIWCDWSQQSEKFNEKDQLRVWKSFGKRTGNPVRMPTLMQAAKQNRFERQFVEVDLTQDADDSFGASSLPVAVAPSPSIDIDLLGEAGGELDLLSGGGDEAVADTDDFDLLNSGDDEAVDDYAVDGTNWRSKLDLTDEGQVKSTLPNIQLITENDARLQGCFAYNEFTVRICLIDQPKVVTPRRVGPKGWYQLTGPVWKVHDLENGEPIEGHHLKALRQFLETPTRQGGWGLKVSDRDLEAGVYNTCRRANIHPLRDKLRDLHKSWDGEEGRLETTFIRYLGCPDTPYHRQAARIHFTAMIARIEEPGCKYDFMPILQGGQGKRKSTFIRMMGMGFTGELDFNYHDKKGMIESCLGRWVMEFPELVGFNKAESETMKRFATAVEDDYRVPYEKFQSRIRRTFVFMGSTNDDQYLRDPTGNRRYWPLKLNLPGSIDTDAFEVELPQIMGEAYASYLAMREAKPEGELPLYLTDPEAKREAEALQEGARVETSATILSEQLAAWLDTPIGEDFEDLDGTEPRYRDRICTQQIWMEFMQQDGRKTIPHQEVVSINNAMKMVPGWEAKHAVRIDGLGPRRGWVRTEAFVPVPTRTPKKRKLRDPEPLDLLS